MTSNPLVPLDLEGLCAMIRTINPSNSTNVVPIDVVEVDLLFVDKMLEFVVIGVVPTHLLFRLFPCCHVGWIMTKEGRKSGECIGDIFMSLTSIIPCWR